MGRLTLWATAASAVLVCGTAEASSSTAPRTTRFTAARVVALSADGSRVGVHLRWKLKIGTPRVECDGAVFWRPGGKASRVRGRGCDFDPITHFDTLTLGGTRLVWLQHFVGNSTYCFGPFTATLRALKPVRVPNDVCDRLEGSPDTDWDFAAAGGHLVALSYEWGYCEGPPDCDSPGAYEEGVTLYSFAGRRFAKIASLPGILDTRLEDVDSGRILLLQGRTLQVLDTHGMPLVSVPLAKKPRAALLSGTDLVAAVGGSLLDYDPATGALRATWPMRRHGRLGGLADGRALYVADTQLRLVRLSDGHDTLVKTVPGLSATRTQLTSAGLFYATNTHRDGRVTFLPAARLPR